MKVRTMAAAAALVVAAGTGAAAAATAAEASTPAYLNVTLLNGPNSHSGWNSAGDPQLTVGYPSDQAYAEMQVNNVPAAAPSVAPTLTTDNYAAGSPRWVVEFKSGDQILCYPVQSGDTCDVTNGPAGYHYNAGWPVAVADVGDGTNASANPVTAAFIVADGDQSAGTTDTLTDVQYNGQVLAPPVGPGTMVGYASKCLDDYRSSTYDGTKIDLYSCNKTAAQNWALEPDGTVRNAAGGATMCLDDTAWGGQGTGQELYACNGGANERWTYSNGHLVNAAKGLCLNDPGYATANGTQQILWACGNYANEKYTQP